MPSRLRKALGLKGSNTLGQTGIRETPHSTSTADSIGRAFGGAAKGAVNASNEILRRKHKFEAEALEGAVQAQERLRGKRPATRPLF